MSLQTIDALKNLISKMTGKRVSDIDVSTIPQGIDQVTEAYNGSGGGGGTLSDFANFCNNMDIDYAYDSTTGANYTILRIYKNKLDGSKQYPFVFAPHGANACVKTSYEVAHENNDFCLVINAGVFDTTTHKPDGLLIQNGTVLQSAPSAAHSQCRPLVIDSNGDLSEAKYNANANELVNNGVVSAVCGFLAIVKDYQAVPSSQWNNVSHYTQNAQRQIIGQFGNGDYAILTCEGRNTDNSDGWTIEEAQQVCIKHGLKFAYNLDGGGSTEMMIGLKHFNHIYEGETGRGVPTYIVFNGTCEFDKNATPPIVVEKILSSISATKATVSYNVDDTLNVNDITVMAHYSDGTSANVTSESTFNTSDVDMSEVGSYNITISYMYKNVTKTTTIGITVADNSEQPLDYEWLKGYSTLYANNAMYAGEYNNRLTVITQTLNGAPVKYKNSIILGYLIPIPSTATKVTVYTPGYFSGLGLWNDKLVRKQDPGWSNVVGTNTYEFASGAYQYFSVNVKNKSNTNIDANVDTSSWRITFE